MAKAWAPVEQRGAMLYSDVVHPVAVFISIGNRQALSGVRSGCYEWCIERRKSGLQVYLIDIDIETDGDIAEAAGVSGTPTIQIFKDKARVENLPGVKMKSEYREKIEAMF